MTPKATAIGWRNGFPYWLLSNGRMRRATSKDYIALGGDMTNKNDILLDEIMPGEPDDIQFSEAMGW